MKATVAIVYQFNEATIHHRVAKDDIRQKRYLVGVELRHCCSCQLSSDGIVNGIGDNLQEIIHPVLRRFFQSGALYRHFCHLNANLFYMEPLQGSSQFQRL